MPAYFSMIMEFSRAELDFDNMKELTRGRLYRKLRYLRRLSLSLPVK